MKLNEPIPQNVGAIDRGVRLFAGLFFLILAVLENPWWALIGLPLIITGLAGWCGVYSLFGMSSCPVPVKKTKTKSKKKK